MANPNQPIQTCVLRVDLKCCTGCQKKAKTKLMENISGVTKVEYNQDKGLLTVTGHVKHETLLHQFTKWRRKAELFSVNYQLDDLITDDDGDDDDTSSSSANTSSNPDPSKRVEHEPQEKVQMMVMNKKTKNKKGLLGKALPFGCFSNKTEVFQPIAMRNQNPRPTNIPYGPGFPFANPAASSSLRPPYPMMQQQPRVHMPGAPMPYNPYMFPSGAPMPYYNPNMCPPPTQPYFMSTQPLKVNPKLHYQ